MTAGVFICHASEDAATARRVVEVLEAAGVPCWIAPRDIPPGSNYTQAIIDGLAAAPALVLVFSASANDSPHVRRELETAVGTDTALFPLRLDTAEPTTALRYFIGTSQWLDAGGIPPTEWEPQVVAGVRRMMGEASTTRPSPPTLSSAPGRASFVANVLRLLDRPRGGVVTLTGLGGVGKSTVAAEVAAARPGLAVLDDAAPTADPTQFRLATSRLPLGWSGERVVTVPPLPPEVAVSVLRDAAGAELSDDDAVLLCERVGHLPLGLELAAARLRVVGTDRLISSLAASLDLVAPLRDAIDWSVVRTDPEARDVLELLASIRVPLPPSEVEQLVADPFTALTTLTDLGLLLAVDGDHGMHYVVPHPVRLVTTGSLAGTGRGDAVRSRITSYLRHRVAGWTERLDTADGPQVVAEFSALATVVAEHLDADLAVAAVPLWIGAGRLTDGLAATRSLLAANGEDSALHAAAGRLAYHLNDWVETEHHLRFAVEHGAAATAAAARCYLSGVLLMSGRTDEGRALAERARAELEPLDLYPQTAEVLSMLAVSHAITGDLDSERTAHERRLEVVRQRGDLARTADALNTLAEIALDEEEPTKARRYAEESLGLAGQRLPLERRDATITLARAQAALGDVGAATAGLTAGLDSSAGIGQDLAIAQCLRLGGVLTLAGGDPELTVRLFAAAHAISPPPTGTDEPLEHDLATALRDARTALGDAAVHEWVLGGALPLPTVLTQLNSSLSRGGPRTP